MSDIFFEQPILNSPYEYPRRHWELDDSGQPTQKIIESRRRAEFISPIPKPRYQKTINKNRELDLYVDEAGASISTDTQKFDQTDFINTVRRNVEQWRAIPNYHGFMLRDTLNLSRGTRSLLQGHGEKLVTCESSGQMIKRVMPELMDLKNIIVINDEAHHCYREKDKEVDSEQGRGAREDIAKQKLATNHSPLNTSPDTFNNGRFPLFRNYDDNGKPFGRPHTLLIDSRQLESGDALDDNFRTAASYEIERFRDEVMQRTGNRAEADNISDADLLREVMNTAGKSGRLGDSIKPQISAPQPPRETIHVNAVSPERDSLEIRFPRVAGYSVELPEEKLNATFTGDSKYVLTPEIVGATKAHNSGIAGEGLDLTLQHLHLIVEIKGIHGNDASAKKLTVENYWLPAINRLQKYGRWAFSEFTDLWNMEEDFGKIVDGYCGGGK